jgi:hypothetical protein
MHNGQVDEYGTAGLGGCAVGEVLTVVNGRKINGFNDLRAAIRKLHALHTWLYHLSDTVNASRHLTKHQARYVCALGTADTCVTLVLFPLFHQKHVLKNLFSMIPQKP